MMRLCRMDGNSIVSCKDEVGSARKLEKFDWKEEQQLPSGWSCKISRRLRRADWKEGQEFLAGWSFRDIWKESGWKKRKSFLQDGASRSAGGWRGSVGRKGKSFLQDGAPRIEGCWGWSGQRSSVGSMDSVAKWPGLHEWPEWPEELEWLGELEWPGELGWPGSGSRSRSLLFREDYYWLAGVVDTSAKLSVFYMTILGFWFRDFC